MADDTSIGGAARGFPLTRRSAIAGVRSEDARERERSLESIIAAYWKPVYKYIRIKWGKPNEDAKDLTQEFFATALEKSFFASYDAAKGRFRTFLRVCLDAFIANQERAGRRLKRGGDLQLVSLEFESVEGELKTIDVPSPHSTETYFDTEWVRSLLGIGVEALRAECEASGKQVHFKLFERYDLERPATGAPTYDELAKEFGIPATQVTNHLAFARREFRRLLLDKLRELTINDEEFRLEARFLLGTGFE